LRLGPRSPSAIKAQVRPWSNSDWAIVVRPSGVALAALSTACFVSVTSENLPVALLPQLAAGFGVAGSAIGLLVTGYAIVVAVSVVPPVGRFQRPADARIQPI
jgi:hypothetical protein